MVTVLLLLVLLICIKKIFYSAKFNKILILFLAFGSLSGLFVYIVKMFENTILNFTILDIMASIQYPLYLIFITPLFGVNYLLQTRYETFSLAMSAVYVLALILVMGLKR